ncbi:hypothetical protein ACO03_11575 [Pantoea ananatis]|nr:hypothetical protein ACO03_11575 [Pantoea ananatis]
MTTNYRNPVDGDVQALIDVCKSDIARLEGTIRRCEANKIFSTIPGHKRDLLIRQIALAALAAEPVYQFIVNNPDKDGYIEWADCNPDYFSNEPSDRRRILYTTAPAQLLRPVELPEFVYDAEGEPFLHRDEVVELLSALGYEVKND